MTVIMTIVVQYIQHDYDGDNDDDVNLFLQPTAIDDWQSRVDTAEVIVTQWLLLLSQWLSLLSTQWLSLLSSQWLSSNNSPIVCSILCKLNHWMIELVEANLGNHHQGLDQNKDLCSSFWTHYVCCFVPLLIHWDRRVQGWWRGESLSWSCRCTEPCPGGPATPWSDLVQTLKDVRVVDLLMRIVATLWRFDSIDGWWWEQDRISEDNSLSSESLNGLEDNIRRSKLSGMHRPMHLDLVIIDITLAACASLEMAVMMIKEGLKKLTA